MLLNRWVLFFSTIAPLHPLSPTWTNPAPNWTNPPPSHELQPNQTPTSTLAEPDQVGGGLVQVRGDGSGGEVMSQVVRWGGGGVWMVKVWGGWAKRQMLGGGASRFFLEMDSFCKKVSALLVG